jgi:hypothetical protein
VASLSLTNTFIMAYFQSSGIFVDKVATEAKVGYQLQSAGPSYQGPPSPYWHSAVDVAAAMTSLQPYGAGNGYPLMSAWPHRPELLPSDYNGYESTLTSGYDVKPWSSSSAPGGSTLVAGAGAFRPLHTRLTGISYMNWH